MLQAEQQEQSEIDSQSNTDRPRGGRIDAVRDSEVSQKRREVQERYESNHIRSDAVRECCNSLNHVFLLVSPAAGLTLASPPVGTIRLLRQPCSERVEAQSQ